MAENENIKRDETESSAEEYHPGGSTGSQFVKKIGVAGCIFFLAMSIIFTAFCLFSKPADNAGETPSGYEQTEEGTANG